MMSSKMSAALNRQLNAEAYSSYLYLSMAAWFESQNLMGMGKWMRAQSHEEYAHAVKFFDHLIQRGAKVSLTGIDAPPVQWKSALACFEEVLKHEQKVTALIHHLAELAEGAKDRATMSFLQWFITEQVEEEANAGEIVAVLRMIKDSAGGLLQLDHRLGHRGDK